MAEEEQDPYSSITDDCLYSSSQEELLIHAKFAREDETFPDDENPPTEEGSGVSLRKLDGVDDSGGRHGGEFASFAADSATAKNLGFRGERKGSSKGKASGTKSEAFGGGKGEIESQLKKSKVSPLIHCSGKMVIEGEDGGDEVVAIRGDLKVKMTSSSLSIVPETEECTEKLDSEDVGDVDVIDGEKKLESFLETEVIDFEEGKEQEIMGGNEEKCNADKESKDDDKKGDDRSTLKEEDITRRGKRGLPPSMSGLVWGEGTGDENQVTKNGDMEDGSKGEASVEEKRDGEFKCDQEEEATTRCIWDVLRMFANEACSNDDSNIDVLETVKRRGMTFPRSRFLPEVE